MIKFVDFFAELGFPGLIPGHEYGLELSFDHYLGRDNYRFFSATYVADEDGYVAAFDIDRLLHNFMNPGLLNEYHVQAVVQSVYVVLTNLTTETTVWERHIDTVMTHKSLVFDPDWDSDDITRDYLESHYLTLAPKDEIWLAERLPMLYYAGINTEGGAASLMEVFSPALHLEDGLRFLSYKPMGMQVWRNFVFANNFNCPELLQLPCVLAREMDTEYSEALNRRAYRKFGVNRKDIYTVTTGYFTRDRYEYLVDFLKSPFVSLVNENVPTVPTDFWNLSSWTVRLGQIEILDYDWTPTDKVGELLQLQFSFRFVNPRSSVQVSDEEDVRIFEENFNRAFS